MNILNPLPYEAPKEVHADDLEVVDATDVSAETSENLNAEAPNSNQIDGIPKPHGSSNDNNSDNLEIDDEGQITLF